VLVQHGEDVSLLVANLFVLGFLSRVLHFAFEGAKDSGPKRRGLKCRIVCNAAPVSNSFDTALEMLEAPQSQSEAVQFCKLQTSQHVILHYLYDSYKHVTAPAPKLPAIAPRRQRRVGLGTVLNRSTANHGGPLKSIAVNHDQQMGFSTGISDKPPSAKFFLHAWRIGWAECLDSNSRAYFSS